uniref:uncharacterized protein n=1 Tax=Semicossyphus pulcher TaxID=241346 RepID=UPI0037E82C0B
IIYFISGEEVMGGNCFNQELEEIVRTVLGNLDSLQPFSSTHFNVFPYKKQWKGVSKVMCKQCDGNLRAYPFILFLYLEKNMENEKPAEKMLSPEKEAAQSLSGSEPQSKRCKRDSPLEEAMLQDIINDLVVESKAFMVRRVNVDNPCTRAEANGDPGHGDKNESREFVEPQQKSDVNTLRGSGTPGEAHSGKIQEMDQEEDDEEGDNADSVLGTPVRPGILSQLARHVFPFSLLLKDP